MRYSIDTHVFLWAAADSERLSPLARAILEDPEHEILVSAAVAWEIALKWSLGKLHIPLSPIHYVPSRMTKLGFRELPISFEHMLAITALPKLHADPFDRILVAQAQIEDLTLLSADTAVLAYPVKTVHA